MELNEKTNYYETAFRQYDPQIGRFTAIDPLADQFGSWTPYQYGYNDPIYYNDVLGLAPYGSLAGDPNNRFGGSPGDDAGQVRSSFGGWGVARSFATTSTGMDRLNRNNNSTVFRNVISLIGDDRINGVELAASLASQGNENWKLIFSDDFEDAADDLAAYVAAGEITLDNLIIGSHGFPGIINADGKAIQAKDLDAVNGGLDESNIKVGNDGVERLYQEVEVGRFRSVMDKEEYDKILALKEMVENVRDEGNVIFAACTACTGQSGIDLGKGLSELFGGRVNVFLNGDQSSFSNNVRSETEVLSVFTPGSLTAGSVNVGWTRFGTDGTIENIGDLILNLTGEPIIWGR